jgi:hypothetical protein
MLIRLSFVVIGVSLLATPAFSQGAPPPPPPLQLPKPLPPPLDTSHLGPMETVKPDEPVEATAVRPVHAATAKCRDGVYIDTTPVQAGCSNHGGVDKVF